MEPSIGTTACNHSCILCVHIGFKGAMAIEDFFYQTEIVIDLVSYEEKYLTHSFKGVFCLTLTKLSSLTFFENVIWLFYWLYP